MILKGREASKVSHTVPCMRKQPQAENICLTRRRKQSMELSCNGISHIRTKAVSVGAHYEMDESQTDNVERKNTERTKNLPHFMILFV